MSMYSVDGDTITGIADAIRSKTGSDSLMTIASMASAIEGIPSGKSVIEYTITTKCSTAKAFLNQISALVDDSKGFYARLKNDGANEKCQYELISISELSNELNEYIGNSAYPYSIQRINSAMSSVDAIQNVNYSGIAQVGSTYEIYLFD